MRCPGSIFTKDAPAFKSFYKIKDVWPAGSQERLRRNLIGYPEMKATRTKKPRAYYALFESAIDELKIQA